MMVFPNIRLLRSNQIGKVVGSLKVRHGMLSVLALISLGACGVSQESTLTQDSAGTNTVLTPTTDSVVGLPDRSMRQDLIDSAEGISPSDTTQSQHSQVATLESISIKKTTWAAFVQASNILGANPPDSSAYPSSGLSIYVVVEHGTFTSEGSPEDWVILARESTSPFHVLVESSYSGVSGPAWFGSIQDLG
jgi:hypothetical protein